MKEYSQFQRIISVLVIFTLFIHLSGCISSKIISSSELPVSGNYSYIIHGQNSQYLIEKTGISDRILSGKINIDENSYLGGKIHIYLLSDSIMKISTEQILRIPLDDIAKVELASNTLYRVNKSKYKNRVYSRQAGDPYSPTDAGIHSFLIPGFGQMTSGEVGRGIAFLGSYIACAGIIAIGYESAGNYGFHGSSKGGIAAVLVGVWGMLTTHLCSIVDAVHVAKVNNLAFRDRAKTLSDFKIQPFIFPMNNINIENKVSVGMTIKVTF